MYSEKRLGLRFLLNKQELFCLHIKIYRLQKYFDDFVEKICDMNDIPITFRIYMKDKFKVRVKNLEKSRSRLNGNVLTSETHSLVININQAPFAKITKNDDDTLLVKIE